VDIRHVRSTVVVRCSGRIVAGPEVQLLRDRVADLLLETKTIVLQLSEVSFLDSSGMGALMQLRAAAKSRGGEISLCEVPRLVQDALALTGLLKLFRVYGSEAEAVAAGSASALEEVVTGKEDCILCVSDTADVRTFVRTILTAARYKSLTCESLYDAKIFLNTSKPKLIILAPQIASTAPDWVGKCGELAPSVPIISLDKDFSAQEAGHAGRRLLQRVDEVLRPTPAS
jgi:anti-anti-sigma factor